jgi:hypothetical protein
MNIRLIASAAAILAVGLLSSQCGSDESPSKSPTTPGGSGADTIPPAAISDLVARNPTVSAVFLIWTAPGDDGNEGTAASYEIRYHDAAITDQNWDLATQFDSGLVPKPASELETVRVYGLDPVTTYHFAIKTTDEAGNESGLSNSISSTTLQEAAPPGPVTDLEAVAIDEIWTLLTWTAPGDDGYIGTASQYEIRYSATPISASTWHSASEVPVLNVPKSAGEPESLLVSGLRPDVSYYFAMKASDEVPNWSAISNVAHGMGYYVELEVSSQTIHPGEYLTIRFRAPGGDMVAIHLTRYGVQDCDPSHPWVVDSIEPGRRYAEGVYELSYDFKTSQGDYLPRATYYVILCWQFDLTALKTVHFVDPD